MTSDPGDWVGSFSRARLRIKSLNLTGFPLLSFVLLWGGEMVQGLRVLNALAEDLGLVLSTHTGQLITISSAPGDSTPSSGLHGHRSHMLHMHT